MLDFSNDNAYDNITYNEKGGRILALFRYWNIINYFYPYKYLTTTNWDYVLKKYIPLFLNFQNNLEYETNLVLLFRELNDSHVNACGMLREIELNKGNNYAPIQLEYIQNKVVVVGLDKEYITSSKIQYGDIVTHVDGIKIEDLIDSLKVNYPSSNYKVMMRDITSNLLRSNNYSIDLNYVSNNKSHKETFQLCNYNKLNIKKKYTKYNNTDSCFLILDNNIGYVNMLNMRYKDLNKIKYKLRNTSGIIVDIRGYPSELLAKSFGGFFVDSLTFFEKSTIANLNNPGEFYFGKNEFLINAKETYGGKVVVLVNEQTQSKAEYTTMAMIAGKNSILVGGRTAGTDGDITTIYLPGGIRTAITTQGVYYPNGDETQCIGLVPDYLVEPTIEGIKDSRDEVLDEAIKIIKRERK